MSLGEEFQRSFGSSEGVQWIAEAEATRAELAKLVPVKSYDHALLVGDRFLSMATPLEDLGYAVGIDETLYLGEVEGLRYLGISAVLPEDAKARASGWFDYVLISQPGHQPAYDHVHTAYKGGPVLHHVAIAVDDPAKPGESDEAYALRIVPEMIRIRARIAEGSGAAPQKLTMSLPAEVLASEKFKAAYAEWTKGSDPGLYKLETMAGGGFFLQFATSDSYRVEIVIRHNTKLGFNPAAQTALSRDVQYSA